MTTCVPPGKATSSSPPPASRTCLPPTTSAPPPARGRLGPWPGPAAGRAAEVDRRARAGERLPLAGVPLAVKATEGLAAHQPVACCMLGCVPVGAASAPVRGTGWQTWGATDHAPTPGPHDPRWTPGGSPAGSAATAATGADGPSHHWTGDDARASRRRLARGR